LCKFFSLVLPDFKSAPLIGALPTENPYEEQAGLGIVTAIPGQPGKPAIAFF
jgi:hypothetical protein